MRESKDVVERVARRVMGVRDEEGGDVCRQS